MKTFTQFINESNDIRISTDGIIGNEIKLPMGWQLEGDKKFDKYSNFYSSIEAHTNKYVNGIYVIFDAEPISKGKKGTWDMLTQFYELSLKGTFNDTDEIANIIKDIDKQINTKFNSVVKLIPDDYKGWESYGFGINDDTVSYNKFSNGKEKSAVFYNIHKINSKSSDIPEYVVKDNGKLVDKGIIKNLSTIKNILDKHS